MSKLSDFLEKQKVDPRRILIASKKLEAFRPEDRAIQLARKKVSGGKPTDAEKALAEQKSRSGKPVTKPTLNAALAGGAIPNGAKGRIVRALNHVLVQKKKSETTLDGLF